VDINSVADELYSLPPEEFTASRNLREQEAKALGDMLLAAEIHRLAKPNTAAWLANQLVREHSDEVRSFLDLGAAFSEATAMLSGDQLRELGRQRRERVRALLAQVRGLANASGHKVSQDAARAVESTLHAALADERVAEQLSAGRLTDTLQSTSPRWRTPSRQPSPRLTWRHRVPHRVKRPNGGPTSWLAPRTKSGWRERPSAMLKLARTRLEPP